MSLIDKTLTFFGFTDKDEDITSESTLIHNITESKPGIRNVSQHIEQMEIRISFPKEYEDSVTIAHHLQNNRAVLVHLQYLDPSTSKRLIDFLCGTAYAMSGNMKKISDRIFMFSPKNVLIEMAEDISDVEKATNEYEGYKIENVANFS